MTDVLQGFATLGLIIGVGYVLAQRDVIDARGQVMLAKLSFLVGTPALLFMVLADADLAGLFSKALAASAASTIATLSLYVAVAHFAWKRSRAHLVIGALSASFVNAGNLGLPIAAYILGDAVLVAPVLLMQTLVLQPVALAILDHQRSEDSKRGLLRVVRGTATNPITMASLAGIAVAAARADVPAFVANPLDLVGGLAIPAVLLSYGASLRLGSTSGGRASRWETGYIAALKLVVQPALAYAVGMLALGLSRELLLAVVVLAALPTAQNVFVYATIYRQSRTLARDSIFVTTVLSIVPVLLIAALLA